MKIIINKDIPEQAISTLKKYGQVIPFGSRDITYNAISCHPDIFFCKTNDGLVAAPNLPEETKEELTKHNIEITAGEKPVGAVYPYTAPYNAVVTSDFLIHNLKVTDRKILSITANLKHIHVQQGYTRCNLLEIIPGVFITSDKGIEKRLKAEKTEVLYVDPAGILLPGFPHGFFGGACGFYNGKLFITGNINMFREGKKIRDFLDYYNTVIVNLYNGKLFDGGSIIFI